MNDILMLAHIRIMGLVDTGGPVVILLLAFSVVSLAVTLYKLIEFQTQGVGRHKISAGALELWGNGRRVDALNTLGTRRTYMATLIRDAMNAEINSKDSAALRERLYPRAEVGFGRLQSGFRLLDSIAQLSPLLGLFGTVLGMIDAFRALQDAGSSVDPSILAGGIWVALMTTAVGLAVAMPTSLILTWFESRLSRERLFADEAIEEILSPGLLRQADENIGRALQASGHAA